MTLAVVWFKRDLRVFDHLPLIEASLERDSLCMPIRIVHVEMIPMSELRI